MAGEPTRTVESLHKDSRGKSKYWYCAYTLANGVRRFRSTKQTKKGEAMKVAAAWTIAAQEAVICEAKGTRGRRVFAYSFSLRSTFISALQAAGVHEDNRNCPNDTLLAAKNVHYRHVQRTSFCVELGALSSLPSLITFRPVVACITATKPFQSP
jgi:hypothetical protein